MAAEEIHEASSSSSRRWSYDVLLSFRGVDTRKGFTYFLYHYMTEAGINVFRDDNELRRGELINPELFKAIEGSRISVIVFSTNYAASRWCLEELAKIMECRQTDRQLVLPIFYKVDPSDVRKQTGSFAEAFVNMKSVLRRRWRRYQSGGLLYPKQETYPATISQKQTAPWMREGLSRTMDEGRFVKKIMQDIFNQLSNTTYLNLPLHEVGLNSRLQKLISLLSIEANGVRIIGICAIGGMGKTTIAKVVYKKLFRLFDGSSFLENVRNISKQPNGQLILQERLLSDMLKSKDKG